jgi:hypothetical protein
VGAEVEHVVSLVPQLLGQVAFHLETGVIPRNRNSHAAMVPAPRRPRPVGRCGGGVAGNMPKPPAGRRAGD